MAKPDPIPFGPAKVDVEPVLAGTERHPGDRPPLVPVSKRPIASASRITRQVPVQTWAFSGDHRDRADDDAIVLDLADTLIQQAGDEWHAPWSIDDPYFRCSGLLSVELAGYDQVIIDRVETEAYRPMLDAAEDLADRLLDEQDDPDW